MSEENKTVELTDEELKQVSGGYGGLTKTMGNCGDKFKCRHSAAYVQEHNRSAEGDYSCKECPLLGTATMDDIQPGF